MYSKEIRNLVEDLKRIPGVGPRTATRFAFFLSKTDPQYRESLAQSITNLINLQRCPSCFKLFKNEEQKRCNICRSSSREKDKICVVQKEIDLENIEKSGSYKGLYFILGGTVSSLGKEDIKSLRIGELQKRAKEPEIKEIILALNPTVQGENTARLLSQKLKDLNKKITSLGRGLPTGGEVEYADQKTLSSAFETRR